jgi:phosphoadenosine phosphosulfate reductase
MEKVLTYNHWDEQLHKDLTKELGDFMEVIKWAYQAYKDRILYSCSFGAEGIVLIDLISKVNPEAKVVFLDTNLHFKETYTLIEKVKQKYPRLTIKITEPSLTLSQQVKEYGDKLWERKPDKCCNIRKIIPLEKELSEVDAWISGLRREQSVTRRNTEYINKDHRFKRVKICPLIHWKWEDVWNYIEFNHLPYNELHDNNYPSIGCEMCTLQVHKDEDQRSGRWANTVKKECGLHQS